jgi:hypothetical protein
MPFNIGDTVQFKITGTTGIIVGIEQYPALGQHSVFFRIKLADGRIWVAKQDDLEPSEEPPS